MEEERTVDGVLTPDEKKNLQERIDAMTVADMVLNHRAVKEKINEIEKRADKPRAMLRELEGALMAKLIAAGADSIKTEHGTVYKYTTTSAVIEDNQAFWNYAVENDASDLFQARASATAVVSRMEAGDTVPGVRVSQYSTARVRKS